MMAMDSTVAVDMALLAELRAPVDLLGSSRDEFPMLASQLDLLADVIEENWSSLPAPIKKSAIAFAYQSLEERPQVTPRSVVSAFQIAFHLMRRGFAYIGELSTLATALIRVKDAILTAIERENPEFTRQLTEATGTLNGTPMTSAQVREWIRKI